MTDRNTAARVKTQGLTSECHQRPEFVRRAIPQKNARALCHVSVHVVGPSNTCPPMSMSRPIAAHAYRASLLPSAVGSDPGCGPGLQPRPRGAPNGLGSRRPASGSEGPALDGAAAARLAPFVAAPVERSAAGAGETAPARTPWASARRATWPPRAGTDVGAGGRGRSRHAAPACGLPALPGSAARRGSSAPASSGDGAPSGETARDRGSAAPLGLPRVW